MKWFSGNLSDESIEAIAELVSLTDARRLIDFGSGKGYQYLAKRIHEHWGGLLPHCYDVGVEQLDRKPPGLFDGLICTDVMEHIAEDDVRDVLEQALAFLDRDRKTFAYFNVFCNESGKLFSDGQSVHLTVRPPDWWERIFSKHKWGNLTLWVDYEYIRSNDK